jgi:hypothetical protein
VKHRPPHETPPPAFAAELPAPPARIPDPPPGKARPTRDAEYGKGPEGRGGKIVALALKGADDDDDRGHRYGYAVGRGVGHMSRPFFEEPAARPTGRGHKHGGTAAAEVPSVVAAQWVADADADGDGSPTCPPFNADPAAALASDAALADAVATPYARVSDERQMMSYAAPAVAAEYAFALPPLSARAVPEPTGAVALALAGVYAFLTRRRRR